MPIGIRTQRESLARNHAGDQPVPTRRPAALGAVRSEHPEEDRAMSTGPTSVFERMLDSLPSQTSGETPRCPSCGWSPDDGEEVKTILYVVSECDRCGQAWRDRR